MKKFGLAVSLHDITIFNEKDDVARHADRLADAGFDMLIPCVKNPHGAVDFITDAADVNPKYPAWDPLSVLIDACQSRGIKVHPWFCVFIEGENSKLLREHPEFQAKFELAERWACACRQEVQDYVFNLYKSLVQNYRPAGVLLDYIRTGWMCKCRFCAQQMRARGVDLETVQQKQIAFEQWKEWRVSRLSGFVRRLHGFTAQEQVALSAAVFSGYPDCIRTQAQDWVEWAEQGAVDILFPMTYTSSIRVAEKYTIMHLALVRGLVPIWEFLDKAGFAAEMDTKRLLQQMEAVLNVGAQGIGLFDYPCLTDEDLHALRRL